MINTQLDITNSKELFEKNRKVCIENFFDNSFVEILFKYILTEKNWDLACGINSTRYQTKISPANQKKNDELGKQVVNAFSKDQFSYIFHRSMNNKNPSMIEQNIRNLLSSTSFIQMLRDITNIPIEKLNTMFLSKYKSGHFLSPHSDRGNGKLTFVIYLSKHWKPHYGGILHFISQDRSKIIDSFVPGYNQLILFEVDNDNHSHYISNVSPNVPFHRYAITGWYD